jgi:hypothetical protein
MFDQTSATIWAQIALAHAETAAAEAEAVSCYLDLVYSSRRNRRAQAALAAADFAAEIAKEAMNYLDEDNYDAVVCVAYQAYDFLVQARRAAQDAALDDA